MSLTAIFIRGVGVVLVLVGLALVLGAVGVTMFALTFMNPIISIILGLVLIVFGAYLTLGHTPSV